MSPTSIDLVESGCLQMASNNYLAWQTTFVMKKRYATVSLSVVLALIAQAQDYCSPSFASGCFSWANQTIEIGSLSWVSEDCTVSDHTAQSTAITAGEPTQMIVTSGNWTGCAVWVDLNDNMVFDDAEDLYHAYVGGTPGYTYDFEITIPANTPTGSYRMRVIAGWGSNGVSPGPNGFGPCGDYQYGNFDDFTLDVSGVNAVAELATPVFTLAPNPTADRLFVRTRSLGQTASVRMIDARGREVLRAPVQTDGLDVSALAAGVYTVEVLMDAKRTSSRVVIMD